LKTFNITIKRYVEEEYEMSLDGEHIMAAFDEARRLVAARNKTSKMGKFAVTKISEIKNDESSNNVSTGPQKSACGVRSDQDR
jgi:hypothetical protein